LQERIKQDFNDSPKGACLELTMTLIETKTLGTAAASIEFTSIPQTYTDLVFLISGRTTSNINGEQWVFGQLSINGQGAGVNHSGKHLAGRAGSAEYFDAATRFYMNSSTSTANAFGNAYIYIPNYTSSANKSISTDSVNEDNSSGGAFLHLGAQIWSQTAAITSVAFTPRASVGDLAIGTTISLYGILKGSSGGVVVS
jgi:hypothetical protein